MHYSGHVCWSGRAHSTSLRFDSVDATSSQTALVLVVESDHIFMCQEYYISVPPQPPHHRRRSCV